MSSESSESESRPAAGLADFCFFVVDVEADAEPEGLTLLVVGGGDGDGEDKESREFVEPAMKPVFSPNCPPSLGR